jgi:hypothetical protein
MYLYYKVLNELKEKKLSREISVSDLLFELSKVYEVHIDRKKNSARFSRTLRTS